MDDSVDITRFIRLAPSIVTLEGRVLHADRSPTGSPYAAIDLNQHVTLYADRVLLTEFIDLMTRLRDEIDAGTVATSETEERVDA